jgi:hypothetical protein
VGWTLIGLKDTLHQAVFSLANIPSNSTPCSVPHHTGNPSLCLILTYTFPRTAKDSPRLFLVCTMLFIVKQYTDNPSLLEDPKHPCYNFFTQGNPGTGKTFVIMKILNCIRVLRGCVMECAASVAPTGCAASLSKGRTSHRFFKFPTGNRINAQPFDSKTSKIADAQAFLNQMEGIFALVSDEVSMKGRKHFAWEDHRCREGPKHIVSNTDRTWDGIPLRLAFGDVQQLPAVACKAL